MSYDAQRALALRLLLRKGASGVLTVETVSAINVSTDSATVVPTSQSVIAVVLPASGSFSDTKTLIRGKYRAVYFTAPSWLVEPTNGARLTWGGEDFVLSGVSKLDPDASGTILVTANAERV